MEQFFEFVGAHWILSSLWVFFLVALITYHQSKSGQALGPHQATQLINRENGVVVDIRDKKEFAKGHIVEAVNVPLARLKEGAPELNRYKERPVLVVCNLGNQSGEAVTALTQQGFSQATRLRGGITEWRSQGLPLVTK